MPNRLIRSLSSNPKILADAEIDEVEINGLNASLGSYALIYTSVNNTKLILSGDTRFNFDGSTEINLPPNEEVRIKVASKLNNVTNVSVSFTFDAYQAIADGVTMVYEEFKRYLDERPDY